MISINATPKFALGQCVGTPGGLAALTAEGILPHILLDRHVSGDWGDMDAGDKRANDQALEDGGRIFSAYVLPKTGVKVWIITEATGDDEKRTSTCILLPEEY
jgi:hypothetical protein